MDYDATSHTVQEDLELAKDMLHSGLGLVAIKGGRVITSSRERGVRPLVEAVLRFSDGDDLRDAAIADRVVGRASAMLCIFCGAAAVYTPLVSEGAASELKGADVLLVADTTTRYILNREGNDMCPFEKMTEGLRMPAQVVAALRAFFEAGSLSRRGISS